MTLKSDEPVLLSYNTTFNVGDFFVSCLVFKHVLFKDGKTIPAAFLVHDRKNQESHDDFFRLLSKFVPNLNKGNPVIVTDRELSFTKAIQNNFPNMNILYCWNHLKKDVTRWLTDHGATQDDKTVYSTDVVRLLQTESLESFSALETELKLNWSEAFVDHFDNHLKQDMTNHAAKWVLQDLGVYNPYSGITNNISEGTNNIIDGLKNWTGAPLDSIVLSMHYLQNFKRNEIIRGRLEVGTFRLKSIHKDAILDPDIVEMPRDICKPEEIISLEKGKLTPKDTGGNQDRKITGDSGDNGDDEDYEYEDSRILVDRCTSQRSLAIVTLKEKRIVHVPETGAFIVTGSKGDKYAVQIFPVSKCNCPSLGDCYHILAAKMSIGMEEAKDKKTYNLTQLRKNSRKRPNKIAGKKKPRPIDKLDEIECKVVPAPDSTAMNDSLFDNDMSCNFSPVKSDQIPEFHSTPITKPPVTDDIPKTPISILKRKLTDTNGKRQTPGKRMKFQTPKKSKAKLSLSHPKKVLESNFQLKI